MTNGTFNETTRAQTIFDGSDATATRRFLRRLEDVGRDGVVAAQLFRAQKTSTRAKRYRGGKEDSRGKWCPYRSLAYDGKSDHLKTLCEVLEHRGWDCAWGWGEDRTNRIAPHVLYVELPTFGQVSFHSEARFAGPDYPGQWDGEGRSAQRIIGYCDLVLYGEASLLPAEPPPF
jgi:hypothetical protein